MKTLIATALLATTLAAQTAERRLVDAAAEAMGGKDKLLSLQSLTIYGYGQLAYQDGGGNIVASPDAPQKWININGSKRTIDLANSRMRLEQRQYQDFVFAYGASMTGAQRMNQVLDGSLAYNVNGANTQRVNDAQARQRRIDLLDNPATLIRTALDAKSKLANLRRDGTRQVVDLTTPAGDSVRFAIDEATKLPAWMEWVSPHMNYGDVTYRTHYVGYQDEKGVRLPYGYNTVMDFRNVVYRKLYIDRYGVNEASPADLGALAAPANVRSAAPPPAGPTYTIEAVPVAKGIWYLRGGAGNSTLYEFADHLTLFECYGNEASTLAIIAKARQTVPGKPVTQCIVTHHHIDHSGGVRAAVSEGLEIVTHRGNAGYFQEVTSRPARQFPDALARNPKPLKILPVDDHLKLKDSQMELDIYRAISNSHMANALFTHVPGLNLVSQGDFTDEGWDQSFWANTYPDSLAYWKLTVTRDLSVHGNMHTWPEVLEQLRSQVKGAQALCAKADAAGFPLQGCPVNNLAP